MGSTSGQVKRGYFALNKDILNCQSAAEIERFVLQNNYPLNDVNLSTAFRSMASYQSRNADAFSKLLQLSHSVSFPPRGLSSICHSLAKTKHFTKLPAVFVDKVSKASVQDFPAQSISNTVWSFASFAQPMPDLFNRVGDHLVQLPSLSEFTPQALSNTLWAFATLRCNHRPLFAKLEREICSRDVSTFDSQSISNVTWSYATLGYTSGEVGELFRMLGNEVIAKENFPPSFYSIVCWSLAKSGVDHPPLFTHVGTKLPTILPKISSLVLGKLCWSFATTDHPDKAVFLAFANELLARSGQEKNDAFELPLGYTSNLMWSFAKADVYVPQLFDMFARALLKRQVREPKASSVILRALATCGPHDDTLLLDHLAQELLCCKLDSFTPHTVSTTLWSLATLNYNQHGPITTWLAKEMLAGRWQFDARQMGNICWAMVTLQASDTDLFTKFANDLVGQDLSLFEPQVLSNLLWTFSKTNFTHAAALGAIADELKRADLNRFSPQAISNCLLAMATLNYVDVPLLDVMGAHIKRRGCQSLDDFSSQSISNVMWAFKSLEYRNDGALAVLVAELERRGELESFSAQACSVILLAFAKLDYTCPPKLLGLLVKQLLASDNGTSVQHVINSMWAVACLDAFALEHVREWFASPSLLAVAGGVGTELDDVCTQQLLQTKVAWEQQQLQLGPSPLIESIYPSSKPLKPLAHHQAARSSQVHLKISALLQRELGEELQHEVVLLGGAAQVDIYLPKYNAVVEVDGPVHFFVNLPSVQTGSTRFKHRLLRRAGFNLVSIPVSEFTILPVQDQAQYVSKLVRENIIRP
ncbi:hypothetical protein BASA81_008712 [Batrachochytrium salamandrivorans]|nr:hypothetical protein BASA81_008712 [Batrachochytrium salamandrivorans]